MADRQISGLTGRSLSLTDVIPTQVSDGASEVGKNTLQEVKDLVVEVVTKKVSLSSAQILLLNGTPIDVVPAQGTSKFIQPIGVVCKLNWNGVAYATNTDLRFKMGASFSNILNITGFLGNTADTIVRTLFTGSQSASSYTLNQPLQVTVPSGNPTAGDGTLDIYLTYTVISL